MAAQRTHVRHIQQAQTAHRALRHETVDTIRSLHRAHVARLEPQLQHFTSAYASELQHLREDDETAHVPLTWIRAHNNLRGPVRNVIRDFATQALAVTIGAKQQAARQGGQDAILAIHKALQRAQSEPGATRPQHVAMPESEAIHRAINTTGNGQPVSTLYDGIDDEADDEVQQAASTAALQGRDDTWLRNLIIAALMRSLYRALTIARNETLDCYRDVTLTVYVANGNFLRGWVWQANLATCCMACALMHGSVHDISEGMDSHVVCQCSAVPLAEGDTSDNGDIETGYDWLQRQDDSVLLDKLGPAGLAAYRAGDVDLDQFLKVDHDPKWGDSIYQASLRELGLDASDYTA